jgi:hypothetical protein
MRQGIAIDSAIFGKAVAAEVSEVNFPGGFMKTLNRFLMSLVMCGGLAIVPGILTAQQTPDQQPSPSSPSAQQPQDQPQQPSAQPQDQPQQQPAPGQPSSEAQGQTQEANGQVFSGTVVKSGDKYILQMADGTAYNLDHQDLVKKYEGKQVRVKGTLDQDGKTIHITQ